MTLALIVAAAVCGAMSAALMSPGLLGLGCFCLVGVLISDGIAARRRHKENRP